ncbi:MAG: ComEC/Rec2 family competence protein, partial [Thiobacillus sp.]|nr:ComEC/Rec2 family competence protein [Thiobacillus sp.]
MRFYLIAFCLGVWLLQQQATLPPARWLWLLPLLSSVLWLPRFSRTIPEILRRLAVALLIVALGFAWAAWRADLRLAERLPDHWQGVDISLVGVVSDLPQSDARGERFVLDIEQVLTPNAPDVKRIQIARYWPRHAVSHTPTVHAGERWQLTVRLKRPYGTHNPHGFDLEAWMLERGIAASGYVREQASLQRLAAHAATPTARIAATRAAIREQINATLGDAPYAGVIVALVIGDQRGIPHE